MKNNEVISNKIKIIQGDIIEITRKYKLEIVVNAAKPTLMGGTGVDGAIHKAVDASKGANFLNRKIIEKFPCDDTKNENIERCGHGHAVITEGFDLSKYIIHAVGPKWDGGSKSCLDDLKKCYFEIFEKMKEKRCISIVIPVISSGSYEFPFSLASQTEIVAVFNFLNKLYKTDYEYFNEIDKIYLVVSTGKNINEFNEVYEKYKNIVTKKTGVELLYLNEKQAHEAYLKEVKKYDYDKRNYFGIVRIIRLLLIWSEKFFLPNYVLIKLFADKTWGGRRRFIEFEVLIKMLFPLVLLLLLPIFNSYLTYIFSGILLFLLLETIVYATKLLFLSDILNRSANVLRSLVLLLVNYFEIYFSFAFFYKVFGGVKTNGISSAIYSSFEYTTLTPLNKIGETLICSQNCITIYFIGIVLAVLISNFQQRKFNI